MVEGLEILSVTRLPEGAKNAMASVAAAKYTVRFRKGYEPEFDWKSRFLDFCSSPSIVVTNKTKKSQATLDLKPFIYHLSLSEEEKDGAVHMLVNASSSGNIKPLMVMEAFYREYGESLPEFALSVTRTEIYTREQGREDGKLIPLKEAGEEF